jgi:hypothetical protein
MLEVEVVFLMLEQQVLAVLVVAVLEVEELIVLLELTLIQ